MHIEYKALDTGQRAFAQGDLADKFYIILNG
jgi:hypothetical protein